MANENKTLSTILMDRGEPLGNSEDGQGRRALHMKDTSGLLAGVVYDSGVVQYPNTTTEVYVFKKGGLTGQTVLTLTLVYSDATKENLVSFERA